MDVGVLSNNINYQYIEPVVGEVSVKEVGMNVDPTTFLKSLKDFHLDLLVLDTTDLRSSDEKEFLKTLMDYRISQERTRIIVLDLNRKKGCFLFSEMVGLGLYDIIEVEDLELISFSLRMTIDEPKKLAHAIRFKVSSVEEQNNETIKKTVIQEKVVLKKQLEKISIGYVVLILELV